MPNISVPEGDPEVEICFVLSTGITERVVVTAQTGLKAGAANPATGSLSLSTVTVLDVYVNIYM